MKKTLLFLSIAVLGMACQPETETKEEEVTETVMTEDTAKLRHVVMFKFKDEAAKEAVDAVVASFANLPNEIPEIKGFEWGTNNSPEGLDEGFTHIFTLTFDSEEGRAVYLPHPAHKAFGEGLGPVLDKVMVLDYWKK
ncbi:Dabb family protein [Arcticibacterium luteifluviistationis]|uniref:Stress protein n=1 Tax=Arcticibacterium luteifluviistationis TaxID=1784714 RepID=A0A2Z4GGB5_9BACT|nr:Dabb family protein [Arcticibacterium luteifluviistationis]AWW00222.1 stress protein [Arcticibacterium luteifluviistationis]